MRWVEHVARNGAKLNAYKLSVLETETDRPLRRPGHRWNLTLKLMFYR